MKNANIFKTGKLVSSCLLLALFVGYGCSSNKKPEHKAGKAHEKGWKAQFAEQLPLLGHRNWILIVDKAFPAQNSEGIKTIYTRNKMLPVLSYVLTQMDASSHVKPLLFTDKELLFLDDSYVQGITSYRTERQEILKKYPVKTLLHDSVFTKIDKSAELFNILVLKTDMALPYTSVFIQLDCKYWNAENETKMRAMMSR